MNKYLNVQSLLWLALILALAGSLKHLAAIFASIDGNTFMGWLQAVAVDAGLFALAYSIRTRRADKRNVKPLWFGVTMFTLISIYGNLAYGLLSTNGVLPGWIASIKPIVLAASLPILVLFLSELLSDDRQHAAMVAEREARKGTRLTKEVTESPLDSPSNSSIEHARTVKAEQDNTGKEERLTRLFDILSVDPDQPITRLADSLGVSRGTVYNDLDTLEQRGAIHRNGHGIEVKY